MRLQRRIVERGDHHVVEEVRAPQQLHDGGREPGVGHVVLELDVDAHAAAHEIDDLLECRGSLACEALAELPSDVDGRDLRRGQLAHLSRIVAHAHQVAVVHDHEHAVPRVLHVELSVGRPGLHRRAERRQGVFRRRDLRTAVRGDGDVLLEVEL